MAALSAPQPVSFSVQGYLNPCDRTKLVNVTYHLIPNPNSVRTISEAVRKHMPTLNGLESLFGVGECLAKVVCWIKGGGGLGWKKLGICCGIAGRVCLIPDSYITFGEVKQELSVVETPCALESSRERKIRIITNLGSVLGSAGGFVLGCFHRRVSLGLMGVASVCDMSNHILQTVYGIYSLNQASRLQALVSQGSQDASRQEEIQKIVIPALRATRVMLWFKTGAAVFSVAACVFGGIYLVCEGATLLATYRWITVPVHSGFGGLATICALAFHCLDAATSVYAETMTHCVELEPMAENMQQIQNL